MVCISWSVIMGIVIYHNGAGQCPYRDVVTVVLSVKDDATFYPKISTFVHYLS
jgi:hypothetical protein